MGQPAALRAVALIRSPSQDIRIESAPRALDLIVEPLYKKFLIYSAEPRWFVEGARQGAARARRETASDHEIKRAWAERVQLLRVMAHPVRLMILDALADRSQCVKDLNSLVPIVQPRLSQHVGALRKAELIDCHAKGAMRCYYLLRPTLVRRVIRLLREKHPPRLRGRDSILREIRRGPKTRARGG